MQSLRQQLNSIQHEFAEFKKDLALKNEEVGSLNNDLLNALLIDLNVIASKITQKREDKIMFEDMELKSYNKVESLVYDKLIININKDRVINQIMDIVRVFYAKMSADEVRDEAILNICTRFTQKLRKINEKADY